MLDTVNLWLPQSQMSSDTINNLDRLKVQTSTTTEEFSYYGYLKNYKVSIFNYGISLTGSLAKYHLQDNFQTLTRKGAKEAIESLSDHLHLKLCEAKVTRVDIADNFIMKHQHKAYYDLLGTCPKLKRLVQPKSVYYSNSKKQLIFYNKIAEGRYRGQVIPEVWDNKQVLRYELRLLRNSEVELKTSGFKAQNLYDEETYMKLIDIWFFNYQQVNKIRKQSFAKEIMNDSKLFEKQLMLLGLKSLGGEQEVLGMIDRGKSEGKFSNRMQASRLKSKIQRLSKDKVLTEDSELVIELDTKVKQAIQFYR